MRLAPILLGILAGCVYGPEMAVLPASIEYRCAEGRTLAVERSPDGSRATASFEGRRIVLRRAESAAQEKYVEGGSTLYLEGDQALLEVQGTVVRGACRSAQPLPTTQRIRY